VSIGILAKVLIDDKNLRVGVSMLGMGKLRVFYKPKDITITALPAEKFYLMDVFTELAKNGIDVRSGNEVIEDFLYKFAHALSVRGTILWDVFFTHLSPAEMANHLLEE